MVELDQLAKDGGGISVTAFPVPAEQVDHFLDKAFRRILIRLVAPPIRDHSLMVNHQRTLSGPQCRLSCESARGLLDGLHLEGRR